MTEKTKNKSQTFQQITRQQKIKDILSQPNIILKERHGGLTVKIPIETNINDEVKHLNINEISQTETNEKEKYTYKAITILEDEKITEIRKKIFNLEKKLENVKEKNKNLTQNLQKNNDDLKLKEKEIYGKEQLINIETEIKNKQNSSVSELQKLYSLKEDIEEKELKISKLKTEKNKFQKEIVNNHSKINNLESNINKLSNKLNKYTDKLTIPSPKPLSWFDKSDKLIELEKKQQKTNSQKTLEKIFKKKSTLNKEMQKIWNSETIEKVYEEILPIDNNIYYITTFLDANLTITEKILYFDNDENNKITIWQQKKQFKNINAYKNDFWLIDKIASNNNVSFSEMPIKEFIKQQNEFKLKPSKAELKMWIIITTLTISIPIIIAITPFVWPAVAVILIDKLAVGLFSVTTSLIIKHCTSVFSTATKKVESWFYNKWLKNQEKKDKEKKELKSLIKDLTSDKIEIKLQTQFDILKQELDNRKDKKVNELISDETAFQTKNNLNIENKNSKDFDPLFINSIDLKNQPSTNSKIYHSNQKYSL